MNSLRPVPRAGFTLIEMMAVVAIIGMVMVFALPNLGTRRWRVLGEACESVAASLEFARQGAILTGVPHRVLIDLEDGRWRVEWLVSENEALAGISGDIGGTAASGLPEPGDTSATGEPDPRAPIDLHPPTDEGRDYRPVANQLGSFTRLDDTLYFVGLESPSGWIEGGDVQIVFDTDGTTELVLLELADAEERHMTLEIEPMLDRILRREGPARS